MKDGSKINELSLLLKVTIALLFLLLLIFVNLSIIDFKFFYLYVFLINASLIYQVKRNTLFLVFFIFSFFYVAALIPKIFYNLDISGYTSFNETDIYHSTFIIHSIFIVNTFIFLPSNLKKENTLYNLKLPQKANIMGYLLMFLICTIILLTAQSGQNIFQAGGYSTGDSSKSPIYVYFLLFFLLTYYYSKRSGIQLIALIILALAYTVKSILYGSRTEVMQLGILIFYLLKIDGKIKMNNFILFIGLIFLYYLNLVFANIRDNPYGLITGDYKDILNPFRFINNDKGVVSSNEGDVFQSAARIVGMVQYGYLQFFDRVKAFIGFILSIFMPASYLPAEASLITYKQDTFVSGGGGLITAYFYCWFGYLGPFIVARLIVWLGKLSVRKNMALIAKLYLIMVFSTFLQWFAYNPIILFKLCFWVIPIVLITNYVLDNIFYNRLSIIKEAN